MKRIAELTGLATSLSTVYQRFINASDLLPMKRSATDQEPWIAFLRSEVKQLFMAENGKPEPGWYVGGLRGVAYLQHRQQGQSAQVVKLPYPWNSSRRADIFERVKKIRTEMLNGLSLQAAAQAADSRSSHHAEDWPAAVTSFASFKRNHGRVSVSERTWQAKYEPHLERLTALMTSSKRPVDARVLLEKLCNQWEPGSRSRQICCQNVAAFLRHAVDRCGFRKAWLPPASLADVVGQRRTAKRVGYPLTDAEALRLVEGLPDKRWQFAVQLCVVYGLRPEDLRHLILRSGELWSTYRKAGGGGVTEPRQLHPLMVMENNSQIDWHLRERFGAGEKLPSLGPPGKAGDALGTYLKRQIIWKQLRQEIAERGEELTCYSMRHRFVRSGQLRSIPPKVLAAACGHSLESHLRSYSAWRDAEVVASHFDHALQSIAGVDKTAIVI